MFEAFLAVLHVLYQMEIQVTFGFPVDFGFPNP